MKNLTFGIIGTGALGGYYGGLLAKSGKDVHFLLKSDYQWVKEHGLRVDSVNGNFTLLNIPVYQHTSEMPKCDVVLVCLKTTSESLLPALLNPIVQKGTTIVFIQNGLENEKMASALFPDCHLVAGLGFICSRKVGPGHIEHLDYGKLTLAMYDSKNQMALDRIQSAFESSDIQVELSENLELARWKKLVWNIPYNGLSVVLNATTKEMMEDEQTKNLIYDIMLEVIGAANACGCRIEEKFADKMLASTMQMKPYAPSMKLDYDFNRPMEIHAIYERPIMAALKASFKMHKTEVVMNQLHFLQNVKKKRLT